MVAEQSAASFERMAAEMGDFTMIYWRRNPGGLIVRDAKFIEDAVSYDIAVSLFADVVAGVEVGLCAVLRGRVSTVDDIERADEPHMDRAAYVHLEGLNEAAGVQKTRQYTVYGSWDTGDGHRRHMDVIEATDPLHAELIARSVKADGTFLVAGVVEGCVPTEDTDEEWATVNGQPPAPAAPRRTWWKFW